MTYNNDPWERAENPQPRSSEFWGQVKISLYNAVLVKGVGKAPFDPQQHKPEQMVTGIDIHIAPLAEQNVSFQVSRSMIAESEEWASQVLPSIKNLGLSVRELNGKWARVGQKGTGSNYTNQNGKTRERTTFEFVKVFATEDECRADFHANGHPMPDLEQNGGSSGTNDAYGGTSGGQALAPVQAAPVNNTERETALKFLRVIVENAARGQSDLTVVRNTVAAQTATMPLVSKYFTVDSPETMNLIAEYLK
jgi:hypothetical protein